MHKELKYGPVITPSSKQILMSCYDSLRAAQSVPNRAVLRMLRNGYTLGLEQQQKKGL
jgi:hypothetical protein